MDGKAEADDFEGSEFELDNFGTETHIDKGTFIAVAMSGNMLVAVDRLGTSLYSRVGLVKNDETIEWGPVSSFDKNTGAAKVAVNIDGWVMEVHEAKYESTILWRLGLIEDFHSKNRYVKWFGTAEKFGSGMMPSIAINDEGSMVVAYTTISGEKLCYRVGHIETGKKSVYLPKKDGGIIASCGKYSSAALADDGRLMVVYADKSDQLWYNTGCVKSKSERIPFDTPAVYNKGKVPSVAVNSEGNVIEVHSAENPLTNTVDTLWFHNGTMSGIYSRSMEYGEGHHPSVATGYKDGQCYYVAAHHKMESVLYNHTRRIGGKYYGMSL